MRKSIRKGIIAGAVIAAGIGLTASPAAADAGWTVTGASGYAYGYSDDTQLKVARSGAVLTCEEAEADATIDNVTGHSGDGIGTIDNTTWTNCTGPFGLTFGVTHVGTWNLNAVQTTSDPDLNVGSITNIEATISGPACSAKFTGGVPGYYNNATGTLQVDPTAPNPNGLELVASDVSGCLGVIQEGDKAEFSGNFAIDPDTIDLTYSS